MVTLRAYRRFFTVAWQFLPLLLSYARDRRRFLLFGGSRHVSSETRGARAQTLLGSLLTLGPTFIKLGQLLSSRPDILPPEYIDVLAELQDRVPPAPWDEARAVLEADLGPVDGRFEAFDTEAISGASLGQVYRARVGGEEVAVKVRRPNIEDLVEADLRVIRWSIPLVLRFVSEARAFSLSTLADEFARTIREEMDYVREAGMLTEIRDNFTGVEGVEMPAVVGTHSGERVLTMEYLTGTKITEVEELDAMGIDRSAVAERLQRAYLKMVIDDGVYHADPHPGNLAVQSDATIVFYDFGMSGRVDETTQRHIVDFYAAAASQDIDALLDALIALGTLSPAADRTTMAAVMELAIQDARGEDIEGYRVQQIVDRVENTIYEFPLRLPANLALVLRMATVVEGVCVTLDPDFDFIEVATAYLTEQGYREDTIERVLAELRDDVTEGARAALRAPPKLERMLDRFDRNDFYVRADIEDGSDVLDRLARRLVYGLLLSVGIGSMALLYATANPPAAAVAGGFSAVMSVLLYRSLRDRRGIRGRPQFTRQNLRQRRNR